MGDAEGFGQGGSVETSSAAEGDQGEVARIASPFNGDDADGLLHGGVDHANDSGGKLFQRQVGSSFFQPIAGDAPRALQVEREIAAEETVRLQASQKQVGIRDRGLQAPAVADGARISCRRFGADVQQAGCVEAGERASSGADRVNVEHWNADRKPCDFGLTGSGNGAVDEGDVGGSASHIEGDDALEAGETGGRGGAHPASGGAGGQGGDAAARLHDEDAGGSRSGAPGGRDFANNVSAGAGFQVFQVTLHYWLQVGVDY